MGLVPCRLGFSLGSGLEVAAVPTLVHVSLAAIQFQDPRRDAIEHVAVVGHEQQPAPVGGQPLLEPSDGVEVEMVRGFVEYEQHGLAGLARWTDLHERAGQCHALGLAARHRGQRVTQPPADAEPLRDRRRLPSRPGRIGHRFAEQRGVLFEHDDAGTSTATHGPLLRRLRTGELAQQGRFTRSVETDDGDPVP